MIGQKVTADRCPRCGGGRGMVSCCVRCGHRATLDGDSLPDRDQPPDLRYALPPDVRATRIATAPVNDSSMAGQYFDG